MDPGEVVKAIEHDLGVSIEPPEGAMYVVGIDTGRGVYHYRHLNAIYTAARVASLTEPGDAVAEYGAGLGVAALYAKRLGLVDYTLYDLPLVNVFAGNFLMNALGPGAVSLHGETPTEETIKVLPYWRCADAPTERFNLSLNQDSFPEIDEMMVREYLRQIQRTTRRWFLSINHEAGSPMDETRTQHVLPNIVRDFPGFHRVSRAPYWIREGYVEELYRLDDRPRRS
jgi:hypothetical protein